MSVVEKAIQKFREQHSAGEAQASAQSHLPQAPLPSEPAPPHAAADAAPRLPPVILDRSALRAAGLMAPEEETDLLTRQYRKIKHPLVAKAMGRGAPREPKGYLIMIASAMAGE